MDEEEKTTEPAIDTTPTKAKGGRNYEPQWKGKIAEIERKIEGLAELVRPLLGGLKQEEAPATESAPATDLSISVEKPASDAPKYKGFGMMRRRV